MATGNKQVIDSSVSISSGGRADKYWKRKGFEQRFFDFRDGTKLPDNVVALIGKDKAIVDYFQLKGISYGNWVTNEDRFNYSAALVMSLYDLNRVLRFNNNIGMSGTIGTAFGARGRGRALAHFEPWSFMINLTRYHKISIPKEITESKRLAIKDENFLSTGGKGSLAHEYGHALDYFFGSYIEKNSLHRSITNGHETAMYFKNIHKMDSMRYLANEIILSIIWKKRPIKRTGGEHSESYEALMERTSSDYWFRHNELFARAFEQYIQHKAKKLKIQNVFLTKFKYKSITYLSPADFKRVIPLFDKLMNKMRIAIK